MMCICYVMCSFFIRQSLEHSEVNSQEDSFDFDILTKYTKDVARWYLNEADAESNAFAQLVKHGNFEQDASAAVGVGIQRCLTQMSKCQTAQQDPWRGADTARTPTPTNR